MPNWPVINNNNNHNNIENETNKILGDFKIQTDH